MAGTNMTSGSAWRAPRPALRPASRPAVRAMLQVALVALLSWLAVAPAAAATGQGVLQHVRGQILEVDIDSNSLVIDGLRYRVAFDAQIEINGTYGAFTLLEPGMKAEYVYRRLGEAERIVLALRQIPDAEAVPRH